MTLIQLRRETESNFCVIAIVIAVKDFEGLLVYRNTHV